MNSLTRCSRTSARVSSATRAELSQTVSNRSLSTTWRNELARLEELLGSQHEARILVEEVARKKFSDLFLDLDDPIFPTEQVKLEALGAKRHTGVPLQHCIGHWPFRRLELLTDRRALIARPETEELVGVALDELTRLRAQARERNEPSGRSLTVVDLGTGSGAIACALADEDDEVAVIAIDRSTDALDLARENIGNLRDSARRRIRCVGGSWFEPLDEISHGPIDLVIANPPYLTEDEWATLDPVVRDHDPYGALVAGPTGLEDLELIIKGAPVCLLGSGVLVCEIGATQGEKVRELAKRSGARHVEVRRDLAGRDRVLVARYGSG